jgi:hypothetical protein
MAIAGKCRSRRDINGHRPLPSSSSATKTGPQAIYTGTHPMPGLTDLLKYRNVL